MPRRRIRISAVRIQNGRTHRGQRLLGSVVKDRCTHFAAGSPWVIVRDLSGPFPLESQSLGTD